MGGIPYVRRVIRNLPTWHVGHDGALQARAGQDVRSQRASAGAGGLRGAEGCDARSYRIGGIPFVLSRSDVRSICRLPCKAAVFVFFACLRNFVPWVSILKDLMRSYPLPTCWVEEIEVRGVLNPRYDWSF